MRERYLQEVPRVVQHPMITSSVDVRRARAQLGLSARELAEALRMGNCADRTVRRWESGETPITGPAAVAIEAMLAGFEPNRSK